MDGIDKLCQIVETHPSIEFLTLENCKGGDINGYEMLTRIMNAGKNKLEEMYLSSNNISTEEGTYLSDFLTNNSVLKSLCLEKNKLNDHDAVTIAKALKHNSTLHGIDLTGNNITKTGWTALRKAEFDDTSLNAAASSNHTCNIRYPPDGSDLIEGLNIIEMNGDRNFTKAFDPRWVRRKKLYTVLSSRNRDNSNVGHFDDIPVEILPNILHSVRRYSNYHIPPTEEDEKFTPPFLSQAIGHVNPLSLVYEICRNWEESIAVFEALSSCG